MVLLLAGLVDGHIESSISAYYYTKVGNVFTGALCVIGVFLVAYRLGSRGIRQRRNDARPRRRSRCGVFHAAPKDATLDQLRLSNVHLACAAALFILLGAISLLIFPRDISDDEKREHKWRVPCYMGLGALIWASIILMPTLNALAGSFYDSNHVFFILETICVMAFAVSFILKGHGQPASLRLDKKAGDPPAVKHPPPGGGAAPTAPQRQPAGKP